jgi:hypothetical protein
VTLFWDVVPLVPQQQMAQMIQARLTQKIRMKPQLIYCSQMIRPQASMPVLPVPSGHATPTGRLCPDSQTQASAHPWFV